MRRFRRRNEPVIDNLSWLPPRQPGQHDSYQTGDLLNPERRAFPARFAKFDQALTDNFSDPELSKNLAVVSIEILRHMPGCFDALRRVAFGLWPIVDGGVSDK